MISGNCPGKRKHQFAICCLFSGICLVGRNLSGRAWPLCCLHTEHGSSLAWMLPAFSLKFPLGDSVWEMYLPFGSYSFHTGSGKYLEKARDPHMAVGYIAIRHTTVCRRRGWHSRARQWHLSGHWAVREGVKSQICDQEAVIP